MFIWTFPMRVLIASRTSRRLFFCYGPFSTTVFSIRDLGVMIVEPKLYCAHDNDPLPEV